MNRCLPDAVLRYLLWLTLVAMPLTSRAIEEPDYEVIRKFGQVELGQHVSAPNSERRQTCLQQGEQV